MQRQLLLVSLETPFIYIKNLQNNIFNHIFILKYKFIVNIIITNIVASQIKTHEEFGGVIPEIAAREHLEAINVVVDEAFKQAGVNANDITAFAGTVGPGLVGCLLVGLNATKSLALAYDKPFIGINHLNGHISANFIDTELEPPFIALLVSGGHTQIIDVKSYSDLEIIGEPSRVAEAFGITNVAALAYLMFNLFTPPCFAAIGAMNSEIKSKKWLFGGIGLQLAVGYTIGFLVFFFGTLFTTQDFGATWMPILGWIIVILAALIITFIILKQQKNFKKDYKLKA